MIRLNLLNMLLVLIPIFLYIRRKNYVKNKENFDIHREIIVILFFIYVLAVSYLTLKPFHMNIPIFKPVQLN
ncbi:hypothetical protein ACERII_18150 [Evansella sp. AB-rgal1]|uniref:hypothetical protein n=1 Tax=Evansella sp. AB-rgal1 TaxID=3242696 RepID=UPI00359D9F43